LLLIGRGDKITYHYYAPGYDINPALCWQFFEPRTEQKVEGEGDLETINVEAFRYTPKELEKIKQERAALIYAIASDDVLFLKFYLNENYSQEFRTKLYQMNIAIGTGEVGKATAAVGLGFMVMAIAPMLAGSTATNYNNYNIGGIGNTYINGNPR
jgi:hypothetical protein